LFTLSEDEEQPGSLGEKVVQSNVVITREVMLESERADERDRTIPPILYKFRDFKETPLTHKYPGQKLGLRIITDQIAWFSSPRHFNDPFDSDIDIRWDKMTREDLIHRYQAIHDQSLQSRVVDRVDELLSNPCEFQKFKTDQRDSILDEFGIFSVCNSNDNILLWSHYADSHSGFCVGIDTAVMQQALWQRSDEDTISFTSRPIRYSTVYPKLIPLPKVDIDGDAWYECLTTKSSQWKYENEWRYISHGRSDWCLRIPRQAIVEVILGLRIRPENEKILRKELLQYGDKVRILRAKRKEGKFALEFVPA
jgi:hypothetical protein